MAARDIRRLDATITALEDRARALRNPVLITFDNDAAECEFLAAEIADARARLRELLAVE